MRRQCAGCGADMGIKCGKCGNGGLTLDLVSGEGYALLYKCRICLHRFTLENDGVTHGMCKACMQSQKDSGSHGTQGDPAAPVEATCGHETAAGCSISRVTRTASGEPVIRKSKSKGLPRTTELRLEENLARAEALVKQARIALADAQRLRAAIKQNQNRSEGAA